jgi:hypothetical protein
MDPDEPQGFTAKPQTIEYAFNALMSAVADEKPNDRSEKDRYFAILKTEIEKTYAIWRVYCS